MRTILATVLVLVLAAGATAQTPAPALTDTQKLQLQTVAQRIEIAQLKARIAEQEFTAARGELARMVESLQVEGYTLDLQTLTYAKKLDAKDAPKK